jgi:hypothetical protein
MHKWYVGFRGIRSVGKSREAFRYADTPTAQSHPQFFAVMGPFRTKRGALYQDAHGAHDNPHLQTVSETEYWAKRDTQKPE